MADFESSRKWGHRIVVFLVFLISAHEVLANDAANIVKAAIDYWRDVSSYSEVDMTIHRPTWERTIRIRIWTRGEKESLVRVVAPPKDAGNSTLLLDDEMWSFAPKINRVIKIPSSMMNQSWLGSDFSNNDLAKADDLVKQYEHKLLKTESRNGHKVFVVESIPKETAPVVWGKEVIRIRNDHILLEHVYYDQANVPVKKLTALELKRMDGKLVVSKERMQKLEKAGEWTEIVLKSAKFGLSIPGSTFTLSNLRNPRE